MQQRTMNPKGTRRTTASTGRRDRRHRIPTGSGSKGGSMNTQLRERPTRQTSLVNRYAGRASAEPLGDRRATPLGRRTRRWPAVIGALLVVCAAAVIASVAIGGTSTPEPAPTYRPAFDSPGGNSIGVPPRSGRP